MPARSRRAAARAISFLNSPLQCVQHGPITESRRKRLSGNSRGMTLPFQPLNLAFSHMYYSVDMPSVRLSSFWHSTAAHTKKLRPASCAILVTFGMHKQAVSTFVRMSNSVISHHRDAAKSLTACQLRGLKMPCRVMQGRASE